jgi:hypothetical protein
MPDWLGWVLVAVVVTAVVLLAMIFLGMRERDGGGF